MPTIRERERAKKALNYKAFSKAKLRLGCSNIQGPKPCDLWLTSSKALIYILLLSQVVVCPVG